MVQLSLPHIDTRTVEVDAPASTTWEALIAREENGPSAERRERFARLLGCDPGDYSGVPGETGSTTPGFRVLRSEPPTRLVLEGRHRFSSYRLTFEVESQGKDRSRLSATTDAAFPGLKGELYKTGVIRSRAHVVATKRMLQMVARRAESARLKS